ncbi:hypothetical protein [Tsukamurella soli]|uniref:hypothetical protein n=1 Tax=Tsukamurella soli TaxID=644556 RepID=UPI00360CB0E1
MNPRDIRCRAVELDGSRQVERGEQVGDPATVVACAALLAPQRDDPVRLGERLGDTVGRGALGGSPLRVRVCNPALPRRRRRRQDSPNPIPGR